jgi:succinyl-CoA synthetase alpha subunit
VGIILDKSTKVLVQGITGKESSFWTQRMLETGTRIVAGVTPGKSGTKVHGVPVYDLVSEVLADHEIDLAVLYVPARFAEEAALESLEAGIGKVVILADGVPVQDMMRIKAVARRTGAMIIGPNTPGLATLGQAMVGFIPVWLEKVYRPGNVGIISRSGTLTNEISSHIVAAGYGISTLVGCGGDPIPGTRFVDVLALFANDQDTEAVVLVGELGGTMEEDVARYIQSSGFPKPVIAYIAGRTAPEGKRMGHAGAIISRGQGSVKSKEEAFAAAGVPVAETPSVVRRLISEVLDQNRSKPA